MHSTVRLTRSAIAGTLLALALPGASGAFAEAAPQPQGDAGGESLASLFKTWKSADQITAPARAGHGLRERRALISRAGELRQPARRTVGNSVLTSDFGMRRHPILGVQRPHLGVDLAARTGAPVFATADGVVGLAGMNGGYGLSIALEHAAGMETRYGHLSRLNVTQGQRVRKGDVIGFVGSTGLSTGPHLHYETRVNGQPVDPVPYIRRK